MVDYLTPDQGVAGMSLTGGTVLCPLARHTNPCLVLVQPKKTCPNMTKIVDWDLKNQIKQTKETADSIRIYHECEGRIEESISRFTDWHREACCPILLQIMDSFSFSPLNTSFI